MDAREALRQIWLESGCRAAALDGVRLGGSESVLPSSFRVATAALIAAEIWRLGGGPRQRVSVDTRHAAVEFRSEHYFRVDDRPTCGTRSPASTGLATVAGCATTPTFRTTVRACWRSSAAPTSAAR